jgi:hypothetical protein
VSIIGDPARGLAVYIQNTFGDIDGDGTQDSGWVPGGVGGTSAGTPIWASIAVLANARRVTRGLGYIGNRMNYAIWDMGRNAQNEVFNDIVSDPGIPIDGPGFNNGGAFRVYRPPPDPFSLTPPPQPPFFPDEWPFGWFHPAFIGYDLVTGWGTPKVMPLLDRLSSHFLEPINIPIKFEAEFREAITRTGPLSSPGAGFANGVGTLSGGSSLDPTGLVLTLTPTEEYIIDITNISVLPITRKPDDRFVGVMSGELTITLTSAIPGQAVPPPPGTPPPPGAPDPNAPPTPVVRPAIEPSSPPLNGNELRTWTWTNAITVVGRIYKSKSGKTHVKGYFENLGIGGRRPIEGDDILFKGKFFG